MADLSLHIKTVHKDFRLPIPLYNQILGVAKAENLNYSKALIYLVERRLKEYTQKTGLFYCQSCTNEGKKSKMFKVPVGIEEFIFCEDCYFSGKYKEFILRIL